ncbi:TPA: DUF424 family protein [archaeon]|nr:DUF424 family protein [Candidatus Naiadarchaeales archaeon SRR2090153.bin1042]
MTKARILLKINELSSEKIFALCDENLIGKTFENGDIQLVVSERFYKGDALPEKEMLAYLENAGNVSIVGENAINFSLKAKIILKENIIRINGIPHAIAVSC